MSISTSPVIVALDFDNQRDALALADKIDPADCRVKIGKEMFSLRSRAGSRASAAWV